MTSRPPHEHDNRNMSGNVVRVMVFGLPIALLLWLIIYLVYRLVA